MQVMRDITLVLENNKHLELKDCLYVPKSRKNLISVSNLNKLDYSIYFNKNVFIGSNLFCITHISLLSIENNHVSLIRKVFSTN